MDKSKGIAFCGLACCICSENENCAGCRNDGCKDKEWCKNYICCKANGFNGCWECELFPCFDSMLGKLRIRAFAMFIERYGANKLMECLEANEEAGIIYHYDGQLAGDYDKFETEEEIMNFILQPKVENYEVKGEEL